MPSDKLTLKEWNELAIDDQIEHCESGRTWTVKKSALRYDACQITLTRGAVEFSVGYLPGEYCWPQPPKSDKGEPNPVDGQRRPIKPVENPLPPKATEPAIPPPFARRQPR